MSDLPKQYPREGAELECTPVDAELPVVHVKLTKCLGAARLYEVTLTQDTDDVKAGAVSVFALQPNGKWWMIRDFEGNDEDWR